MQLFQQKFLQKISFWKTFPPHKNHNTLQINKLKFFPENFPTKPPSTKYFFLHTPSPIHHQSICQSIASIKPTSSTATTSPNKTPSEMVGYGKCFKRHTSKHQQSHPIPLYPHPPSNKNPLSRSFSLNITNQTT